MGAREFPQQYTVKETAELLGVGNSTVRKWISEGKLRAYRIGGRLIRVDSEDLFKFRKQIAKPTFERRQNQNR